MLGEKLKSLRESKKLLLKDVARQLDVDIAFLSRLENNEKAVNRQHLSSLAAIYGVNEKDLLPLWMGQRVLHLVAEEIDEEHTEKALKLVLNDIKKHHDNR